MAENRLAVLRDEVICRATIFSTRNLSEANQIAPGPGRIGAQIEAADHPAQHVVQHFSMELKFIRILMNGIVQRSDDKIARCYRREHSGDICDCPARPCFVLVSDPGIAKAENLDRMRGCW